jgi:hypothetical protein
MKGFEKFNQMPFAEARKLVTHPVACIDCLSLQRCSFASRGPALWKEPA